MNPDRMRRHVLGTAWLAGFLFLVLGAATPARAQDGDAVRAKELQAKIKKEMAEIDEILLQADKASPKAVAEKIEQVRHDIDELLKSAQERQSQVVSDIEELIRLAKAKQNKNSKGQGDSKGNKDPKSDPKNEPSERERDPDVDELKRQDEERKRQEQENAGKEQPTGGKPDDVKPEEKDAKGEKPPGEKGTFERDDVTGRWGVLPPKVADLFNKLSAEQFPDRYRKLIEQYYLRSAKVKKP